MYQQRVSQDQDVRCLNRQRRANENDEKRKRGKLAQRPLKWQLLHRP
jgi:hypothetical protein